VTPCSRAEAHRRAVYFPMVIGLLFDREDDGSVFLRNFCEFQRAAWDHAPQYDLGRINTATIGVVGGGTLCYKPLTSLDFSIYLILPAALGPGVDSASNRNEYQDLPGGKGRPAGA
jgi:hypothetical protein